MSSKKLHKTLTEVEILKKIEKSGVNSSEQYELIIANLEQQGARLFQQREQLKIRVQILLEKQKQLMEDHNSRGSSVDYNRIKKQLEEKYKQFETFQKKRYGSVSKSALGIQVKDFLNERNLVETQITRQRKLLIDQKYEQKKLQKSLRVQLKYLNKNVPQREVLEEQNKQLRRMISNLRVMEDLTGHVQVRLQNSIIGLKHRKKFVQKLKTMTIQQIRRQQAKSKVQIINEDLKYQKMKKQGLRRLKTQSRLSQQKLSFQSQKLNNDNSKVSKSLIDKQKQIDRYEQDNLQLHQQLNNLQAIKDQEKHAQNQLQKVLEAQINKIEQRKTKEPVQMIDVSLQFTQFEDQKPLPREIIGNQTSLLQDDRLVLKTSKDTLLTGLIVYQNIIGIACIRAQYSNSKQTLNLPPEEYLKNCRNKKVILADPKDYLKWFKAYYDLDQRKLVRLEVYSNNKIKFQVGKQKQLFMRNVLSYKFDNGVHEMPVCMRVSYIKLDGDWLVTSLGLELNSK